MLIEFSVTNFRSIRDRQTFSLVKARGDELMDSNTIQTGALNKVSLLRTAVLYGPNAGGKSNFLLALQAMEEIVVGSATGLQRGDELPVIPFRLSRDTRQAPSEFEVTFIVGRIRYQYGFSATADRIHEEWLLAYPKGRPQHWFGRSWNEANRNHDWEFGNSLTGEKQLWQKSTRENALFLSTAVQLNSEQLRPIYDWFSHTLRTSNAAGWSPGFSASMCEDDSGGKTRVMGFLRAADLGIQDIIVEKKPFDTDALPDNMPDSMKKEISRKLKGKQFLEIKTSHMDTEGKVENFDFEEESDGTQKLFSLAGPWVDSLDNGFVLFIDELHDNLHPLLVQFLVKLFHNTETNPNNAQLVFTTHETSILNQRVFRRDQIWFCEKDEDHATRLYPLTDFSPRKGRENLELAYLSGRYGALPYVRSLGMNG
ncbi:MAG: ATP-binding protein [Gammaproteobacteria bacterium]|nr:ATP-binding protein [Gammaproteobacteria bacterium]